MTYEFGNGAIAGAEDVAFSNIAAEEVLTYNAAIDKWQNKTPTLVIASSQSGTTYTLALADGGTVVVPPAP